MEIRRFKKGDEPALFRTFYSAVHDVASRDYTPDELEAWAPADLDQQLWADHLRNLRPFVVEVKGAIAGYADVQETGYIDHFFVSGAHARQGIGSLLMRRILQEAKSLGIEILTSDVSRTAEPFFSKHGFQVVQRRSVKRRGVMLQNALMQMSLRGCEKY